MSSREKALLYWEDDFPHKILSMGEAAGTEEKDMQDYLLRELMSEGKLVYPIAQRHGGTITIIKNGPVAFMVTTTKAALNPENETRMLSLEIDDSAEQTTRVLNRVALNVGTNADKDAIDFHPWHFFQQWLADGNRDVTVPYAVALAKLIAARSGGSVRLRRDFAQVLAAIKSHALMHRYHRDTDERGQIIADIDRDYRTVAELMADPISEASGASVKKEVQETINAVRVETVDLAHDDGATAYQIGKRLNLDKSSAGRRLKGGCQRRPHHQHGTSSRSSWSVASCHGSRSPRRRWCSSIAGTADAGICT
jgi:urease gamma subunit